MTRFLWWPGAILAWAFSQRASLNAGVLFAGVGGGEQAVGSSAIAERYSAC